MDVSFQVFRGSKTGKIIADRTTRTLQWNEVYIETTHSGLCGTDEHYLHSGQVLGHEGVGIVKKVGPGVSSVKVGDRVGFGYTHKICGVCDNCLTGWDQYCRNRKEYGSHDHDVGSFSEGVVWDANCVFPIPKGYASADAAPMMCGGATVWTALTEYGVRATDRVGIMGIGGLGHLAIKLAAAMGCHVVVLTSSESKIQEAMDFGAQEAHVFRPGKTLQDFKPLKHLLLCGNAGVDYSSIVPLMDTHGTIYPLTVTLIPSPIPLLPVNNNGIRIQGSLVASRLSLRRLFKFAAEKKITPVIMEFPLTIDGIEKAMQTLRDGKMRYRGVLVRTGQLINQVSKY